MSRWRGAVLAVALSAIAIGGVLGYRHLESPPAPSATSLPLQRLDGPGSARLVDWRGTPVVVNLFASWCPACLTELPAFERVSRDYAGRAVIVGVDSQDSASAGLSMARRLGVTYPLLADTRNADLHARLGAQGMPVTAFIRRNGTVGRVYCGQLDEALLRQLVDEVLRQS